MTDTPNALEPILKFLHQYVPYNQMLPAHQEYLAMHLEQVFYAESDTVLKPQDGVVDSLYIIKRGCVSSNTDKPGSSFGAGDCFPVSDILHNRAVNTHHCAVKSTICYKLKQPHFEYLMQQSHIFHDYCEHGH